jgi:hypothetical protein
MKLLTLVLVSTALTGCGMFSIPSVKSGACYAYCLDVTVVAINEPIAVCYGTVSELQAAAASYRSRGVSVRVRQ